MRYREWIAYPGVATASFALILCLTGTGLQAQGNGINEKDQKELRGVVLTLDSVAKLVKTQEAYVNLLKTDAEFRAMQKKESADGGDGDEFSIDALTANLGKLPPKAKAAVTSQGLTPRQYAVLTLAAMVNGIAYAGMGNDNQKGPLPPGGATKANIEFMQKNANHPLFQQWRKLIEEMDTLEGGDSDEDGDQDDGDDDD